MKCTIDEERIIGMTNICVIKTYVNATFAIHRDMKGYTGGLTTLRTEIIHYKSKKQSLNTKSSTESEFVGASDYLPYTIWVKRFLLEQDMMQRRTYSTRIMLAPYHRALRHII